MRRELFEQRVLAGSAGCITCHSLEPDVRLVGPSLHGIALTAMERQEGVIAPNYLYLSIIIPEHYVVKGYTSGLMPASYATELREEEIADLVSYLMTLYP